MFRRILCPVDLADPSLAPLEAALEIARPVDAAITVLYVHEPAYQRKQWFEPYPAGDQELLDRLERREADAAKARLAERIATVAKAGEGPRIEPMVRAGIASDVIDEVAASQHADLIVMGTHARRGLSHALLGSIAEHVVRTAPCAVMTVHATGGGK